MKDPVRNDISCSVRSCGPPLLLLLFFSMIPFSSAMTLSVKPSIETSRHLVLVGGGHAHVQVIRSLNASSRPKFLKVTLVDRQSHACYSGMVPGCVSNLYAAEETSIDLRALAKWAGIEFVKGAVTDVDPADGGVDGSRGKLILAGGAELEYDAVSLDVGSAARGVGDIPGVKEYCIPTRPVNELISRIERAEGGMSPSSPTKVVVVGGGPAGIELAFAMRARWEVRSLSVTLLDAGVELLPHETPECRSAVLQNLKDRNIAVRHGSSVLSVTTAEVNLRDGTAVPFTHCLWAGGAAPHRSLTERLRSRGVSLDKRGWIQVSSALQSLSHPNIFAAGDCAVIVREDGRPSPPKAGVYAVRAGPVLITNLTRFLGSANPGLVKYDPQDDFLKLIMCGDGTAIGFRFGVPLYGKWVWDLKDGIDNKFMDLFREGKLPVLKEGGKLDVGQYDAVSHSPDRMNARDAASLLARTNDGVDYQKAWHVLREMAADEKYQEEVLSLFKATSRISVTC